MVPPWPMHHVRCTHINQLIESTGEFPEGMKGPGESPRSGLGVRGRRPSFCLHFLLYLCFRGIEDTFSSSHHHRPRPSRDLDATGWRASARSQGGWQPQVCRTQVAKDAVGSTRGRAFTHPSDLLASRVLLRWRLPALTRCPEPLAATAGAPSRQDGRRRGHVPAPQDLSRSLGTRYLSRPPSDLRGCSLAHQTHLVGEVGATGGQFEFARAGGGGSGAPSPRTPSALPAPVSAAQPPAPHGLIPLAARSLSRAKVGVAGISLSLSRNEGAELSLRGGGMVWIKETKKRGGFQK